MVKNFENDVHEGACWLLVGSNDVSCKDDSSEDGRDSTRAAELSRSSGRAGPNTLDPAPRQRAEVFSETLKGVGSGMAGG